MVAKDQETSSRSESDGTAQQDSLAAEAVTLDFSHEVAVWVVGAALILLAYGWILDLELVGWDTYPLIAATAGDVSRALTDELMSGRYPDGHFYRPLTSLSFAFDFLLWGRAPLGYHATDLLILVVTSAATYLVSLRLIGSRVAAGVAALAIALHPLQIEVLPAPARRADALCALFVLLGLWAQLSVPRVGGRWLSRGVVTGFCCAFALGSKETGIALLPVLIATSWLQSSALALRERVRVVCRDSIGPLIGMLCLVVLRVWVLGGVGGRPNSSLSGLWLHGPSNLYEYAGTLLVPQPASWEFGAGLAWGLAVILGGAAIALVARSEIPRIGPVLALLLTWYAVLCFTTSLSSMAEPWYAVPFLAQYALALGVLAHCALDEWSRGSRGVAVSTGLVLCTLLASHLWFSALMHSYEEWSTVSRRQAAFLADFDRTVAELEAGEGAVVRDLPMWQLADDPTGVRGAAGLAAYSVQAYADLLGTTVPVDVELSAGTRVPVARPGTVRVEVVESLRDRESDQGTGTVEGTPSKP